MPLRAALAVLVLPLPASAAIQPCLLDRMVSPEVGRPDAEGAYTPPGEVAVGDRVEAAFACENPEALVGGTMYHNWHEVARAGAVELHLDAGGRPAGCGWGLVVLEAPTARPTFPFDHLGPEGGC